MRITRYGRCFCNEFFKAATHRPGGLYLAFTTTLNMLNLYSDYLISAQKWERGFMNGCASSNSDSSFCHEQFSKVNMTEVTEQSLHLPSILSIEMLIVAVMTFLVSLTVTTAQKTIYDVRSEKDLAEPAFVGGDVCPT